MQILANHPKFLCDMFKIYVRPILEYASTLSDIDLLEGVQRSFTRRLPGFGSLSYPERLIACNLEPLEVRRLNSDLVLTFKILKGLVNFQSHLFFQLCDNPTRGHSFKLSKNSFSTSIRGHFFSNRVFNIWNSLPPSAINASSAKSFQVALKKFNLLSFARGRAIKDLRI